MRFADIPGNEEEKKALVAMADSGRVAHAMLFYENEGCGALPLALAYIQYLNCTDRKNGDSCGVCPSCRRMEKLVHPDTYFVYPVNSSPKAAASKPTSENFLEYWRELVLRNPYFIESELYEALGIEGKAGAIAIAEARFILEKLSLTSIEDGWKSVLVWLPEKMNEVTANKLLKVVEEPPEKTLFLFITHHPDRVLQTIFSRCQSLRVLPLPKEDVAAVLTDQFGKDPHLAERQAAISGGSIGVALNALGDKEEYNLFLDIFSDLIKSCISRDLQGVLDASDMMSGLDSREKQKAFCIFAEECIRKIFLLQQNMGSIAAIPEEEYAFFAEAASKARRSFCAKASSLIDRSSMLIDRNVNAKIVFCDLADQIFLNF